MAEEVQVVQSAVTLLGVLDTAVKIGPSAAISAYATYKVMAIKHEHEKAAANRDKRRELIQGAMIEIEEYAARFRRLIEMTRSVSIALARLDEGQDDESEFLTERREKWMDAYREWETAQDHLSKAQALLRLSASDECSESCDELRTEMLDCASVAAGSANREVDYDDVVVALKTVNTAKRTLQTHIRKSFDEA